MSRRRKRSLRRVRWLGGAAGCVSVAALGAELAYVTRHGTPRQTVRVLREGYRAGPANEASLLNLFLSFGVTFGGARAVTALIRSGYGPLGNVHVGHRHIHHFVPGILICLLTGAASIGLRHEEIDHWLALPFGAGAALVLDEAALLLELEDVYWSDDGLLSVEIGLGTLAVLGALAMLIRMARRGEQEQTA